VRDLLIAGLEQARVPGLRLRRSFQFSSEVRSTRGVRRVGQTLGGKPAARRWNEAAFGR